MKNKKKSFIILAVIITLLVVLGITYALAVKLLTGNKRYVLLSNGLQLELDESQNLTDIIEGSLLIPVEDFEGKRTTGYQFSLINKGQSPADYAVYLDEDENNTMPIYALRYNLTEKETNLDKTGNIEDLGESKKLHTATIRANTTHEYTLRIYLGTQAGNDAKNKTYSVKVRVEAEQKTNDYFETVLNGCDPVLTDNLIPVTIEDDGTVKRADLKQEWYNYSKQKWANAVVLEDKTQEYAVGANIPSTNIQSYFVWIPRYKYKLFDMGNYSSLVTTAQNNVDVIDVVFENKNTTPTVGTKVGDYHSHPAFQAFDSNGFWVGKFESGYKGATTTSEAQQNISDYSKLIIRPNAYSWRNITVGNAFKVSYDYLRSDESHMMKNTEWGAVAYLQHSAYGSRSSVRVNNNSSYLTGYASVSEPTCGPTTNNASSACNPMGTTEAVTQQYNTPTGYAASTTGNISGVYDMSGGAWEYVMGVNMNATTDSSEITNIYGDIATNSRWEKYYDKYSVTSTSDTIYNVRILGDATGEMGPFLDVKASNGNSYHNSSWYNDYSYFVTTAGPWFLRGGTWSSGSMAGGFAFNHRAGATNTDYSFRVVLTP